MAFRLVGCGADGRPREPIAGLPAEIAANCAATAGLLQRTGFVEPWVGYVAVDAGLAVGGGAFVGPPQQGVVEIAYYTLKQFEGRRYASRTAAALVAIARGAQPGIVLKAYTLPQRNASTRILERLGFTQVGEASDPDAGIVWEWRNPGGPATTGAR
jgi:RimJ/RimL family protein N-acetyltransferase